MPKNTINEFDRTGRLLEAISSNTVFIPIQTTMSVEPTLFTTEAELKEVFDKDGESILVTDEMSTIEYSPGLGYNLAKHLIKNGLTVLAQGVMAGGDITLGAPALAFDLETTTLLTMTPAALPAVAPDTYYLTFVGWNADDGIVYPERKVTIHSATYDVAEFINKKGSYMVSVNAAANGYIKSEAAVELLEIAADLLGADITAAIDYNVNATKLPMDAATVTVDWTALRDKNLYNVRFLTNGALKVDISQDMIDCAANRGDCVAIVNFNESGSMDYSLEAIKAQVASITNGEYAAAFTPAFFTEHADFTSGAEVLIPAAFGYLFAYAKSIKTNPEWYAIAGFDRGVINELSSVKHKYTTADVNILQTRSDIEEEDNTGIAINAIAYIRPAGNIIYSNRTLKDNDAVKKLTATSFLNVRNMVSLVKKVAYEAANKYTFEQNSETLWVNYKSYIEPTLDKITHSNGALGYSINRIATRAKATLKAEIIIQPIEAVEDIELTVIMTDTTTTVAE